MADNDQNVQPAAVTGGIVDAAAPAADAVAPTNSSPNPTPAAAPAPQKPSLWKSVVAGALAGLANAGNARQFGSGLAAGAQGELKAEQQKHDNAEADQQQLDAKTQAAAQLAHTQAETALVYRQVANLPQNEQEKVINARADQTEAMRKSGDMVPVGEAGSFADALNAKTKIHQSNPEKLITVEPVHGSDGKITYQPFESLDSPTQADVTIDGPDGKPVTIPAGRITGKQLTAYQLQVLSQKLADQSVKNQATATNAKANLIKAGAAVTKAGGANNPAAITPDALGFQPKLPVTGAAGYQKTASQFKKNLDDLAQTEQTYQQFADILKDVGAGKDLTGAQSVVGLFNAIGISAEPLKGKGFRINNLTVAEHAGARGIQQAIEQKFGKLKTGEIITPSQLADYARIAEQVRENKYVSLVNQMHNQGLNADAALPTGNGQKADPGTARIFLRLVGWGGGQPTPQQKQAAQAAMAKKGWSF